MAREIGILMTPENAFAVDDGRKTVTRRLNGLHKINENPDAWTLIAFSQGVAVFEDAQHNQVRVRNPWGVKSDLLYLKEKLITSGCTYLSAAYADGTLVRPIIYWHWQRYYLSPICMPKVAARKWYRRIDNRPPERLQEITPEECMREGVDEYRSLYRWTVAGVTIMCPDARVCFSQGWNIIHKTPGTRWEDNPYCWVISFEKCLHKIAQGER